MTEKDAGAFRTISEVASDLDLPQHVLRFWETRFPQIRPLKRGGGRRFYRPDDVDLLRGIRLLLYKQGYTIRGVQRILKEHGAKAVVAVGRGGPIPNAPPAAPAEAAQDAAAAAAFAETGPDDLDEHHEPEPTAEHVAGPGMNGSVVARPPGGDADRGALPDGASTGADDRPPAHPDEPEELPLVVGARREAPTETGGARSEEKAGAGGGGKPFRLFDRLRPPEPSPTPGPAAPTARLSREQVRLLQTTLFELLECKRILDQAR